MDQVAESVEVLMTSTSASVRIILDNKRIEEACLSISPWSVKNSILKTPRIKLQDDVRSKDVILPYSLWIVLHTGLKSLCNVNCAEYQGFRYRIGYYSRGG